MQKVIQTNSNKIKNARKNTEIEKYAKQLKIEEQKLNFYEIKVLQKRK